MVYNVILKNKEDDAIIYQNQLYIKDEVVMAIRNVYHITYPLAERLFNKTYNPPKYQNKIFIEEKRLEDMSEKELGKPSSVQGEADPKLTLENINIHNNERKPKSEFVYSTFNNETYAGSVLIFKTPEEDIKPLENEIKEYNQYHVHDNNILLEHRLRARKLNDETIRNGKMPMIDILANKSSISVQTDPSSPSQNKTKTIYKVDLKDTPFGVFRIGNIVSISCRGSTYNVMTNRFDLEHDRKKKIYLDKDWNRPDIKVWDNKINLKVFTNTIGLYPYDLVRIMRTSDKEKIEKQINQDNCNSTECIMIFLYIQL